MLFNLLQGYKGIDLIIILFARLFVVFCTLPLHEFAHAFVAVKLGDNTPKRDGRLTINPFAHLDLIGALMIFLVGFGYAKPVQINARNFKKPKLGMAITAVAGPFSNILQAAFYLLIYNIIKLFTFNAVIKSALIVFLGYAAAINVGLAVFNLLPIPPLDGSRILQLLIPDKYYYKYMRYERYMILVVFALIFIGVLDVPLAFLQQKLYSLLYYIVGLPFPD